MNAQDAIDLERPAAGEADGDARVEASPIFTQTFDFLASIWGANEQGSLKYVHLIAEKLPTGGFKHYPVSDVHVAIKEAFRIASVGHDAYFACAAFKTDANRTAGNAAGANSFWFDLDCTPEKASKNEGYATKCDGVVALTEFCKTIGISTPSNLVDSGNGFHCYWHFSDFISAGEWRKLARQFKRLAAKHGLRADPSRTADIASVLRVPGTMNLKDPDHRKQVTILKKSGERDFHNFVAALDQAEPDFESNLNAQKQTGGNFPPSSAHEIIKRCATLAYFAEVRGNVSEPQWRNNLGVVKFTTEGESLCHEWSKGHPRYDEEETQQKIDRWTAGATLCETFRASSDAKCQGCTQTCKSPIRLGWSDDVSAMDAALHEMNLHYFVGRVGGNVFVFDEDDVPILTNGMTFTAFKQLKAGEMVEGRRVAYVWLEWPARRTYQSLVFDPSGQAASNAYNTWRGLAVSPSNSSCKRIVSHILTVWCGRSVEQFNYVMRWLALLVQKPWVKPEVALVLRSKEGAGKTIIVKVLIDIFGPHAFVTAQRDQVAGHFNGHLFDKVLVILEEAFFAGDHASVAAAKALITNSMISYEAKGKDAVTGRSFAHVISLTNNDWAVPAGADSRRWMVLDISGERMGDHAYFAALAQEIENGGAAAFLELLGKIDVTNFNPRVLPATKALHSQQAETLSHTNPVAAFWLHVLAEGEFTLDYGSVVWGTGISSGEFQESYRLATARARHAPAFDQAAKQLRPFLPPGSLTKVRRSLGPGDRYFEYQLPDLQVARLHFEAVTGVNPCAI